MLVRRGDAAGCGVVVGPEVRRDDATVAFGDEAGQRHRAIGGEHRLGGFDHQLELQGQTGDVPPVLEGVACRGERGHLFGGGDLRQRDHEVRRQRAAALLEQRGQEQIEGPEAPSLQLLVERLDPDADRWRQRAVLHAGSHLGGGALRVLVLLAIGSIAEAVLEVDPQILDRLARQLFDDARVDPRRRGGIEAECRPERRRIGSVFLERAQRDAAQLLRRVGLEQMRAAVDDVHRLSRG